MAYKKFIAALIVSIFIGFCPSKSNAIEFSLDGENFIYEPEESFCLIEPDKYEHDFAIFSSFQSQIDEFGRALAAFGNCLELEKLRSGQIEDLSEYGFLYHLRKPKKIRDKKGLNREKLFRLFGPHLTKMQISALPQIEQRFINSHRELGYDIRDLRIKPLGFLGQDDAGIYSGFLIKAFIDSEHQRIVAITGLTVINGQILSLNYFRPFSNLFAQQSEIEYSILQVQKSIEHIDNINNYSFFKDKLFSYVSFVNWWSTLESALIGAFIGLLFLLFKTLYQAITRAE